MSEHLQLRPVRELIGVVESLQGAAMANNELDIALSLELVRHALEKTRSLLMSKSKVPPPSQPE